MMYVRRVSIDEMGGRDETSDGREVFWRGGGVFLVVRESERGTGAGGGEGTNSAGDFSTHATGRRAATSESDCNAG